MRKPRNQSRLLALPQAQRDTIARWLVQDNLTYLKVVEKCRGEFNFKTTVSALSEFYQQHCAGLVRQKQAHTVTSAGTGAALLEIEIVLSSPDTVRLRIIPGSGIKIEGSPT